MKTILTLLLLIPSLSWGELLRNNWICESHNSNFTNCSQEIIYKNKDGIETSYFDYFKWVTKNGEPSGKGSLTFSYSEELSSGLFKLNKNTLEDLDFINNK